MQWSYASNASVCLTAGNLINTGKVVHNEILQDSFTPDGSLTSGPFALFSNMPPSRTLTMNLGVPEPWLVEPVVAV